MKHSCNYLPFSHTLSSSILLTQKALLLFKSCEARYVQVVRGVVEILIENPKVNKSWNKSLIPQYCKWNVWTKELDLTWFKEDSSPRPKYLKTFNPRLKCFSQDMFCPGIKLCAPRSNNSDMHSKSLGLMS